MNRKTICLNMIVKDESEIIRRSLASVLPIIDYWVIVDTGSTDGTQKIIREFMKNMQGELHEMPWVNFEHNRNAALTRAFGKTDYILFIDADEEFVFEKDFTMPNLDRDFYFVPHKLGDNDFQRISIIRSDPEWRWVGIIHEAVSHAEVDSLSYDVLPKVVNIYHEKGGNRAKDPLKCVKDAAILEKALLDDPTNARYAFYLAQTYFEAGRYHQALHAYEKRTEMEGNEQERFWSYYRIAIIQEFQLKLEPRIFLKSYAKAYLFRPSRIEPLYYIASYYFREGKHLINYLLIKIALAIPPSTDLILVERSMSSWALSFQLLQSAYALGYFQESAEIAHNLLNTESLPDDKREVLQKALPLIDNRHAIIAR